MKKDTLDYPFYFKVLKQSPLFSNTSDKLLHTILSMFYVETWSKGQLSFHGEKTLYKFYFVISGRIKMYQINPENGNEYTLYINSTGDAFDIICLLDSKKHEIEMEALDDVILLAAPIDIVREWIKNHPQINNTILPYMVDRLREMEEKVTDLALFDTWRRTLKLFIKHTGENIHSSELKLINKLPQNEVAKIIGTSKNVINKHIQKLKDENIIAINRNNIVVKDLHALISKLK